MRTIVAALLRRAWDRGGNMLRQTTRALRLAPLAPVATDLRRAIGHGVQLHFVFATTDPGAVLLREQTLGVYERLLRKGVVTETLIRDADHTFSSPAARQTLLENLHQHLDAAETGGPGFQPSWAASAFG